MSVSLQQFEHDRSAYDRPNQAWVCGHAADGRACAGSEIPLTAILEIRHYDGGIVVNIHDL